MIKVPGPCCREPGFFASKESHQLNDFQDSVRCSYDASKINRIRLCVKKALGEDLCRIPFMWPAEKGHNIDRTAPVLVLWSNPALSSRSPKLTTVCTVACLFRCLLWELMKGGRGTRSSAYTYWACLEMIHGPNKVVYTEAWPCSVATFATTVQVQWTGTITRLESPQEEPMR
jgi:hypothetical protein